MKLYKITIREVNEELHVVVTTYNLLAKNLKEVIHLAEKKLKNESEHAELYEVSEVELIAFIDTVE